MAPAPPSDSPLAGEPRWLAGLNAPQRDAVTTTEGPVLILAGAGTGKTRALTARLAHILWGRLAFPSQVLAVTFTNKAAREMKERTSALLGPMAEGLPWLGTFHALSAKMLRRHAGLVGLTSDFTILDTDDQLRLLKQVIAEAGIDEKRWPAKQLASLIDRWKNRGLLPAEVPPGESHAFADGLKGGGAALYARYQERLATLNACDFGDLLLHMLAIFRGHPDVLAEYRQRFRYVMVDEYQDTNSAQHQWLKSLVNEARNIACVGDDDQSIYSWRGAEVSNILQFERDFPGAKLIRLEQNYRSTPHILAAANALIANNRGRLGKALFTAHTSGEKVAVTSVWDGPEEARLVGDEAERLAREGVSLNDMAILVRAQFQTRLFEDRFIAIGLPYRIVGGFRFYERAEVRDALAYLRIVHSPDDALAFERIINVPKRGLGDKAMATLHGVARATNLPLPRFVSLKTAEGNARRGPSLAHRIDWVFTRPGMPLRITAEYENWRRVEDADGIGGWVHYALLSGTRSAVVIVPMADMRAEGSEASRLLARLEAGVIGRILSCAPDWCRIATDGGRGWVRKTALWGVAADELID